MMRLFLRRLMMPAKNTEHWWGTFKSILISQTRFWDTELLPVFSGYPFWQARTPSFI
jgi:hypothetical protein